MDNTSTTSPSRPFSLHSTASSITLVDTPDPNNIQRQNPADNGPRGPPRYVFYKEKGRPNPDAQPKPKSKLSKFMSKLQSPAVRATNAARDREKLEDERRGVQTLTPLPAPVGAGIVGAGCYGYMYHGSVATAGRSRSGRMPVPEEERRLSGPYT